MAKLNLSDKQRDALSVAKLKTYFESTPLTAAHIDWLRRDRRTGVQALLQRKLKEIERHDSELRRTAEMLRHEKEVCSKPTMLIAGVDEVGAGPLAGPVVAAAVVLDFENPILGVKDSKLLRPKVRAQLAREIENRAHSAALGWVSPNEIDEINIFQASLLAMKRAVEGLKMVPEFLLVDARTIPDVLIPQRPIIGGDRVSYLVAAASIIAKEARDSFMEEMEVAYPNYGFAKHKGYGTRAHLAALNARGPTPIHRLSFAPVRDAASRLGLPDNREALDERI